MKIIQMILGDQLLFLMIATMLATLIGSLAVWYNFRDTRRSDTLSARKIDQENASALPPLDTTLMLTVPMSRQDAAECRSTGGTFSCHRVHMLVTDRDGQQYFCLMTEFNLRALCKSGFRQTGTEPALSSGSCGAEVDRIGFGQYPAFLQGYSRSDPLWMRWVKIRRNFDKYLSAGGNPYRSFDRYFEDGMPREAVLEKIPALA